MARTVIYAFGIVCYLVFLTSFVYAVGFVNDKVVPRTVDSGGVTTTTAAAVAIDAFLLGLFAVQHSGMARPAFKRWWTRFVPKPIERSTYVLFASLILLLIFWQWRPIPGVVWSVEHSIAAAALSAFSLAGWALVLTGTFLIDHFDLFGLRQVHLHRRGETYTEVGFRTPLLYRIVRHPIMLGFLIAFWATPRMTAGHLLFATATTGYILVAVRFEERDIARLHGRPYEEYRRRVPMLLPLPKRR